MARNREQVIGAMKDALNSRIDEWVGMDIPDEGTEDYESWQSKLAEIDSIESIHDVIDYLESEGIDADDFFLNGEYELLSAGMAPEEIPQTVILNLGDLIAEHSSTGKPASRVFLFDGKYFVIRGSQTTFFDKEHDALQFAGIKGYQSNIGHHRQTASDVSEKLRDAAVWSRVAADPVAKKALNKRFNDPREIDRRVSAGDDSAFDGEYLSDILCDLLSSEGRLYRRFMARGAEWNYPVDIRGLGGVYFVSAPEFEDIGHFLSLEDAEDEVISNWSDSLVSKKGRTYRPPFAADASAKTEQHTASAVAATATVGGYQCGNELEEAIAKILSEQTGVGSYSETVTIGDRSVVHRFSQSTGLRWQRSLAEYRNRFGSDVPAWVLREHPHHRSCLCELSLKLNLALPAASPLENATKAGNVGV